MQNIIKLRKWYKAKPLLNKTEKKNEAQCKAKEFAKSWENENLVVTLHWQIQCKYKYWMYIKP